MAIEGLQVILEKEPIVATPTADRLMSAPEMVDAACRRHVRSYLPLGRIGGSDGDQLSVADYEARLIDLIKRGATPKGYITAEFGYGKTSTALYVWDRCRQAGLLAVPPFQLSELDDILRATYGWAGYELGRKAPSLVPQLDTIYREYTERSVNDLAKGNADTAETLRGLLAQGQLRLHLLAKDYVTFFERVSALAAEAGFAGLVLFPDEVQQYVALRSGTERGDPIAPLHSLIEQMNTRKGQLKAGLIFSIPAKELGVINDQRGDTIQRLKADRLGLDLRAIYDKQFAERLWQMLASEFDFAAEANKLVTPATLRALGQIAAREDLANGPRTVIATFGYLARRYLNGRQRVGPLGPIGLVDAFLNGEIPFDGESKLQQVVHQHLQSELVSGRTDWQQVIKMAAAFPTDGATREVFEAAQLWDAASELQRLAQGDIVIVVGGGRDNRGNEVPYGFALRGLEPASGVASDWLTATIREFARSFREQADKTIERAEASFARLLSSLIFREPGWKAVETVNRRQADATPTGILFRGSFPSTAKRFPERRVWVNLLREGDTAPAPPDDVDLALDVVLCRHLDLDDGGRRRLPGRIMTDAPNHARIELNLFHQGSLEFYPDLQATLQPVVSPYQVTPLLMLALDEYLTEKRRAQLIPKDADRDIQNSFQPVLHDHSLDELFNAELGTAQEARNERIVEVLVRAKLEERFPEYRTVIRQQNWQAALRDYRTALERLDNRYQKQGKADVSGTKDEFAAKFNRANVGFDSFVDTYPDLIEIPTPFKGHPQGIVRFRLHPFEERVQALVRQSPRTEMVSKAGQKLTVHVTELGLIYHSGRKLGYRAEEIDALLEVMAARELMEVSAAKNMVREVAHAALRLEDLAAEIDAATQRRVPLQAAFPQEQMLITQLNYLKAMAQQIRQKPKSMDERTMTAWATNMRNWEIETERFLRSRQETLAAATQEIARDATSNLRQRYQLASPISGEFFAPQLDALRLELLAQADSLDGRCQATKQQARALIDRLTTDDVNDNLICQAQRDFTALQQAVQQLETASAGLAEQAEQLANARRALTMATALDGRLRMSHESQAADLAGDFAALLNHIQQELSARKIRAIADAPRWEAELTTLDSRLTARISQQQQLFEERKARYLAFLQRYAQVPRERSPLSAIFNPLDPAGSFSQLAKDVSAVLNNGLQRAAQLTERWTAQIHQTVASGDLAYLDDPTGAEAQCWTLLAEIAGLTHAIEPVRLQADEREVITDLDEGGKFGQLMASYQDLVAHLDQIGRTLAVLDGKLRTQSLSSQAEQLNREIDRLAEGEGAKIEIGMLLHATNGANPLNTSAFWQLIEELYTKRRVRIYVEPVLTAQAAPVR